MKNLLTKQAVFAGGCFWGVEHLMQGITGVLDVKSGYTGGTVDAPSYEQVRAGKTGHYEAVCITYNPELTDYETLAKAFFEIHDFTQTNGQGPDIGSQYRSAIFYADVEQEQIAKHLIALLTQKGYKVATQVFPLKTFWPAEEYHQDYYARKGTQPYCHRRIKRFD